MRSRTVYTSTIKVPMYAGWICQKCGEKNFSQGILCCSESTVTSSIRPSKHDAAKEEAKELALRAWKETALQFLISPREHPNEMQNNLVLQNTNCTKCGAKPNWNKHLKGGLWDLLSCLLVIIAIFSGIIAFSGKNNIGAWLVFLTSISCIVFSLLSDSYSTKNIKKLPKQFTPVMGSLNDELVQYAIKRGMPLPNPYEVLDTIDNNNSVCEPSNR